MRNCSFLSLPECLLSFTLLVNIADLIWIVFAHFDVKTSSKVLVLRWPNNQAVIRGMLSDFTCLLSITLCVLEAVLSHVMVKLFSAFRPGLLFSFFSSYIRTLIFMKLNALKIYKRLCSAIITTSFFGKQFIKFF